MKKTYYITTPIYYVNDSPHIGHAYTTLSCDVLARFNRLEGNDVFFLTGTDEHGQKVDKAAKDKGVDPQSFCDEVSLRFRDLAKFMNYSNDDFIRTTEPRHKKACTELWKRLEKNGHIYLDKYAGWYSVRDEAFYQESELVDGKAPTGAPVEWTEEESYFFDLSKWEGKLLEFYDKNPDFIMPESRRNEVISFVKGGLKDLSVSRTSFKWGIPVPGNEKHVMYVWLDALTNYLTAAGFPDDMPTFNKRWPADLHMVGKDILRFHAVYWPAFLMAADLPCPKRVFAHGWWTNEGQKISKSLGNVIDPIKLVEEFGLDATRYFLMREVPFGNDGDYSRARMITVINSELANTIGNLAQRTLSMIQKNCEGKVPEVNLDELMKEPRARVLLDLAQITLDEIYENGEAVIDSHIKQCRFHKILEDILQIAVNGNMFIDELAPWTLKKEGNVKLMNEVLYTLAETVRCIAIMLQPFMPASAAKMLDQLTVPANERSFEFLKRKHALKSGTALPVPHGVFPRFMEGEKKA